MTWFIVAYIICGIGAALGAYYAGVDDYNIDTHGLFSEKMPLWFFMLVTGVLWLPLIMAQLFHDVLTK